MSTPLSTAELSELEELLKNATPEQLKAMDLSLFNFSLTNRPLHPIWNPLPGPQTLAFESEADELFFGGSAGGGKSDLILGLAITQHRRSLILRRIAVYLKGLTDRIREIVGLRGSWRGSGYGGTMLLNNAAVELGGCQDEEDKLNYQGIAHDGLFFDEVSHFSRSQYQFICAWNRSARKDQRCRIVCAGNPPTTPEGRWVVEEWAPWLDSEHPNPAKPGELRWYTTLEGKTVWLESGEEFQHEGHSIKPKSRTFIPSRLTDNPILASTDYGARLQALPEPYRSQFLYGDMNAGQDDDEKQVIPTAWVRAAQARWKPGPPEGFSLSCIGVDVARGGKDKTVLSQRYGNWFAPLLKFPGTSTPDGPAVAARVAAIHTGDAHINVDVIGVGSSVYDNLKGNYEGLVSGINNAESTDRKDKSRKLRFVNVRAASYWAFREALDPISGENLELPPDPELVADLCAAWHTLLASGIKVEPKEDIISRIGRSPDCADACVLAFFQTKKKQFWMG